MTGLVVREMVKRLEIKQTKIGLNRVNISHAKRLAAGAPKKGPLVMEAPFKTHQLLMRQNHQQRMLLINIPQFPHKRRVHLQTIMMVMILMISILEEHQLQRSVEALHMWICLNRV